MRRTTLQLWAFIAVILGLGFAYYGLKPNPIWLVVLGILVCILRRRNYIKVCLVVLLALGLGLWRGGHVQDRLSVYESLYDQKITLTVRAQQDANYNKYKQFTFDGIS